MAIIFMFIAMGVSFILLYERKKNWNTDKLRWKITGSLFTVGFCGLLFGNGNESSYSFCFLCIPLIYNCFDRLFKKLSIIKSGRDFYLYLRHSNDIDDAMFAENLHVNYFDKIFSLLLLLIILGLMIFGVLAYRYFYH